MYMYFGVFKCSFPFIGTYPPWAPYQVYSYPPPQQPVEGATSLPFSTVQQWGHPGTAASGSGVVLPANLQPSPHPTVATGVPAGSAPTTTTSPAAHQLPTQAPAGRGKCALFHIHVHHSGLRNLCHPCSCSEERER